MKKIFLLTSVLFVAFSNSIYAQAGILDNTFGNGGKVNSTIAPGGGAIWSTCMEGGWTVVVGGWAYNGTDSVFGLMKYMPDGTVDNSFGINGVVTTPMGSGSAVSYSTLLQADGKILAGGMASNGSKFNFALARYQPNGSLDSSFGNNGKVITSISNGDNTGVSLCTQDGGWTVVIGGFAFNGNDNDFAMVRYTNKGSIDSSFGTNGVVITDMAQGSNDVLGAMVLQPDSSIILGGTSSPDLTHNYFALARYKYDGTPDNSFGTAGKVITHGSGDDQITAMTLQGDGKIVAGGYANNGVKDDFGVYRYQPNGLLDSAFGINGQVMTAIGDTDESIYSLAIQSDGKIIGGGSSISNGHYQFAMTRYNTDGSLDDAFGTGGKVTTQVTTGDNEIYAVAMQNGKILAAGYSTENDTVKFSMARYLTGLVLGIVDFAKLNGALFIYPNPVEQNATLQYTLSKDELVSIRLVDMQGKTVSTLADNQAQGAGDHKQPLLLNDGLAPGAYLVVISSASGTMSIKIVK